MSRALIFQIWLWKCIGTLSTVRPVSETGTNQFGPNYVGTGSEIFLELGKYFHNILTNTGIYKKTTIDT